MEHILNMLEKLKQDMESLESIALSDRYDVLFKYEYEHVLDMYDSFRCALEDLEEVIYKNEEDWKNESNSS